MKSDNFKNILSEKKSKSLPDNFDDNMMLLLNKHAKSKATSKRYLRLMYLFFALGLAFGLAIAFMVVSIDFTVFGKNFSINESILILPVVGAILIIFEKIYRTSILKTSDYRG